MPHIEGAEKRCLEPKKPRLAIRRYSWGVFADCPYCSFSIKSDYTFCPNCAQQIDWSDKE